MQFLRQQIHPYNQLSDYIKVFDNIVPDDLCDRIVAEYSKEQWRQTMIGAGIVDTRIRNVCALSMSHADVIALNEPVRKQLDQELFMSAGRAIANYRSIFPESLVTDDSGYELLRYEVGQFYSSHCDSMKHAPREVSCSFCLNDDYEGGEFSFWDKEHIVKGKKGTAIVFPSNFMYPHEILPVTKGTRYSAVTWFI